MNEQDLHGTASVLSLPCYEAEFSPGSSMVDEGISVVRGYPTSPLKDS
jgi:hypothetical protein